MATTEPPVQSRKHSKLSKQGTVQGLTVLHTPEKFHTDPRCADIIAVPGLGADLTYTWMRNKVHWLADSNMLPKYVQTARISVYGYRSQWFGPDAVEAQLSTISRDLLQAIKDDRRDSKQKGRPIIFVGHSLGGLVVSKAVTQAKRELEEFKGIIDCITACVFLGTPFRGSHAQPLAKIISRAGNILGQAQYNSLIKALKPGTTEQGDLANEFLGDVRKTQIDLVCYFELEKTDSMVVVDEASATFEGHPRHSWARTHSEMNKFDGPKDRDYLQLAGSLKDMVTQACRKIKLRQDAVKQKVVSDERVGRILDALDVNHPRRDLETIRQMSGVGKKDTPTSWIQQSPSYKTWKEESASSHMWIRGNAGKGKTMAAIAIIDELTREARQSNGSLMVAHFFCDDHNKDKSKGLNVLKSLVRQVLEVRKELASPFFQDEGAEYEYSSLPELWKPFKATLSDVNLGTAFFVVNNVDQIDLESRKQLLSAVASFQPKLPEEESGQSGPFVKWLFLGAPREDIECLLHNASVLDLDDGSNSAQQDDDLRYYVSQRIRQIACARGYSRALEYFVRSYISLRARGRSNYDWVNLVCLELQDDELTLVAVRRRLVELPTDLYPMYDQVSHRVLGGSEIEIEYSKDILRCLLLVHYPPTLEELAVVADLPLIDRSSQKELKKYVGRCGALTRMFKHGLEIRVQLSHTSVREFLRSKAGDWLCMGSEQIQHGIIALRCFDYVLATTTDGDGAAPDQDGENQTETDEPEPEPEAVPHPEPQPEADHESTSEDDLPGWDSDEEGESENEPDPAPPMLAYPVTHWIKHALEATSDIVDTFAIQDVFWILESKQRARWSKSYVEFSPNVDNEKPGFHAQFTALHVAAYFGYVPLADLLLRSGQHEQELQTVDGGGYQPLYWACRGGHINMVQRLCEAGADVRYQHSANNAVALHGAVFAEDVEVTLYLLSHGARVDVATQEHGSPLYMAAENGSREIVQHLLAKQADPNLVGGDELTPLNAAVYSEDLEIVKSLVQSHAELNPSLEYENGNALGAACASGEFKIAEYLLEKGCDRDRPNSDGHLPIEVAAAEGYTDIVQLLLRDDLRPEMPERALRHAAEHAMGDVVRMLLTEFPTLRRDDGFECAARKGHAEILKILTAEGLSSDVLERSLYVTVDYQFEETTRLLLEDMHVDANATGNEYGNALQASAYDGTTKILQMLLEHHADPNHVHPDSEYGTPLQAACYEGTLKNVELLLTHGAEVNPPVSGEYGTPLAAACAQGHKEVVELLLQAKALPNIQGGRHGYPIIAASDEGGDSEIIELLIAHGADINVEGPNGATALTNAALELPMSCVQLLVNHGAFLHAEDGDKDTALTNAAGVGDEGTVEYLLEQGLDVQHIGKLGGALYRAIEAKSLACVKVLLKHQVNVNQRGGELDTPLQLAAYQGFEDCVDLLLSSGADVNLTGGKYHTALQAAVAADHLGLVQLLLKHNATPATTGGVYGSALHATTSTQDPIALVDLLLEHGAPINAPCDRGTLLQLAAAACTADVIAHLLERKADPNIVAGKYGTPLQAACLMRDEDAVEVLLAHGAQPLLQGGHYGNAFLAAAANGMEMYVKKWLAPDIPEEMLVEALHRAIHGREPATVEVLLDHGVSVQESSSL